MEKTSISVITCTKNRKESLYKSIRHFYSCNTYPESRFEYIIVNDGTDDLNDIQEEFKKKKLRIIKNKGNGLAAARNTGSFEAKNELLLYLDDDILISPDHLRHHEEANSKFFPCIVTAHRVNPEELEKAMSKTTFGRYKRDYDYIWFEGTQKLATYEGRYIELEGLAGFSCSILKNIFLKIGPFNEKFPAVGNEDLDFYWRARASGVKLIYDTGNNCLHNEEFNLNISIWLKRQYEGMISFMVLCQLYPRMRDSEKYKLHLFRKDDPLLLMLKKGLITLLSLNVPYGVLLSLISLLSKINMPQIIMTKLFNLLVLLNYKKGYRDYHKNILN